MSQQEHASNAAAASVGKRPFPAESDSTPQAKKAESRAAAAKPSYSQADVEQLRLRTESRHPGLADAFESLSARLDNRNNRFERLVKMSRDITVESKRIIYQLQRAAGRADGLDKTLSDAETRFFALRRGSFRNIAEELSSSSESIDYYRRSFSPGVQEFIEAYAFHRYLSVGRIASPKEVREFLVGSVDPESASAETRRRLVGIEDYVLGVLDVGGELMRFAVTEAGCGVDLERLRRKCVDLYRLRAQLSTVKLHRGVAKSYEEKMRTLGNSINSVANACYELQLRRAEGMPSLSIEDLLSAAPQSGGAAAPVTD